MNTSRTRRGFLGALSATAMSGALVAGGQEAHGEGRTFKGTSKKGDLADALQQAISAAERSVRHPDALVEWTLKSVSGRSGGIAGFRDVTVTIEAKVH